MRSRLLKLKGPFTAKQARAVDISPQLLHHYVKKGFLRKIGHGVYIASNEQDLSLKQLIKEKLIQVPQAVVGFRTALQLFDLTESAPADIDLIVPEKNIPKRKIDDVKLHPIKDHLYRVDVKEIDGIPTTTFERTLIDFLREDEPISNVLKIMHEAQRKKIKINTTKLKKLGIEMRAKAKVNHLLEAFL